MLILLRRWMLGWVTAEDICSLAAAGLGLAAADLLADLEHNCCSMELDDPGSVDGPRAVREQGIKVVLATDNMDAFARWAVPALHLSGIFDAILDSASIGSLKDDLVDGQSRSPGRGSAISESRSLRRSWRMTRHRRRRPDRLSDPARRAPGTVASILTQLGLALGTSAPAMARA